jgi:N-acetylglucosaminyldiphosphoundecaprenol N-acetyl-beta-D-mannosaminyltransferase
MPRYRVFGLPLDCATIEETVARCVDLITSEIPVQHVVLNVIKVVLCRKDARLRDIIVACPLVNADGTYFTWAARMLGAPVPERVTGIDLMAHVLDAAEQRGWPVYFLGAKQEALDAFLARVTELFPSLLVAGSHDGYFDNDRVVAEAVGASGARVLFVGLPSPRKEMFIAEQLERMGPVFAMGVGGSFDVWAGISRRAPRWMQRVGLEWLFRLLQEPGRMWRRIVVNGFRFTGIFLGELLTRRSERLHA